ncbi:hypothetical protein BGX38DRAFT_1142111 [Terfezia claveryi]|nr:hypothetical protein BGX38DRAFT_1142111 [Terfezia claveryi]
MPRTPPTRISTSKIYCKSCRKDCSKPLPGPNQRQYKTCDPCRAERGRQAEIQRLQEAEGMEKNRRYLAQAVPSLRRKSMIEDSDLDEETNTAARPLTRAKGSRAQITDSLNRLTQPPKRCLTARKSEGNAITLNSRSQNNEDTLENNIHPPYLPPITTQRETLPKSNPGLNILAPAQAQISPDALKASIVQQFFGNQVSGESHQLTRESLMQVPLHIIDENKNKEIQLSLDLEVEQGQLPKAQAAVAEDTRGSSELKELKKELQGVKVQLRAAEGQLVELKRRMMGLIVEGTSA